MWLLMATFVGGLVYGAHTPPHMRRAKLVALDLLLALMLATTAGAASWLLDAHPLGLDERTTINMTLSVTFVGLAFVVGAWVADLVLGERTRRLVRRRERDKRSA